MDRALSTLFREPRSPRGNRVRRDGLLPRLLLFLANSGAQERRLQLAGDVRVLRQVEFAGLPQHHALVPARSLAEGQSDRFNEFADAEEKNAGRRFFRN